MRPSLLHMISPHSLSAFSASVAAGGVSPNARVQPARTQAAPASPSSAGGPPAPLTTRPPGQMMPRGSLLDLTV